MRVFLVLGILSVVGSVAAVCFFFVRMTTAHISEMLFPLLYVVGCVVSAIVWFSLYAMQEKIKKLEEQVKELSEKR